MDAYTPHNPVHILRVLSDRTRFRMARLLLSAEEPLCVCELADALDEPQYNVSRHLRELKIAGLLAEEREGKWVYYSLAEPASAFEEHLFRALGAHSDPLHEEDMRRLRARLALRKGGRCVVGVGGGRTG